MNVDQVFILKADFACHVMMFEQGLNEFAAAGSKKRIEERDQYYNKLKIKGFLKQPTVQ